MAPAWHQLNPFHVTPTTVPNARLQAFINATGYMTEAEWSGWSFVFWALVPRHVGLTHGIVEVEWWRRVDGVNWYGINDRTRWRRRGIPTNQSFRSLGQMRGRIAQGRARDCQAKRSGNKLPAWGLAICPSRGETHNPTTRTTRAVTSGSGISTKPIRGAMGM